MALQHKMDDGVHADSDFSCYITIRNLSDKDFGLYDFGIVDGYGVWPVGQPLNTIEAHTEPTLQLEDPKYVGGSEGWVIYQVPVGDETATFKLEFSDPQLPWSSNYLTAESSNPGALVVSVQPYQSSGHPFYAIVNVTVNVNGSKAASNGKPGPITSTRARPSSVAKRPELRPPPSSDGPARIKYDIGFDFIVSKSPVHESIAIAAFIQSKKPMPVGTTYNNLNDKQWEYMRGLVWNDDPSCYLFEDYSDDNHHFSNGIQWFNDFERGPPDCMIQRSHHGDLQFLHGMAATDGEEPKETQRKMLKWLEVMYKLACGNQGVSEQDQLKQHLEEWFTDTTEPSSQSTLRDMLLASTPFYNHVDIQRRALGLCLHIIADSYAVGHTQRCLKNPDSYQGRDDDGRMIFKSGTYGDWGAVKVFHCYSGQDTDRHSYYDGLEGGSLPIPKNLESFNSIIGARSAIEVSTRLINFCADGINWGDGVEAFLATEVIGLAENAQPANTEVDESDPVSCNVTKSASGSASEFTRNSAYRIGLQRKLENLEAGVGVGTSDRRPIRKSLGFVVFLVALLLVVIIFSTLVTCYVWIQRHLH
ncbi:hypothetical protein GGR54DRAFT_279994 [Hypoxylon sp. NC1633]|nr:hypothetical protein GGR54DRAFT_279994 [Hypoxylon sp. NC1633]